MGSLSYTDQQKVREDVKIKHSVEICYMDKNGNSQGFREQVALFERQANRAMFWAGACR